MQHIKRKIAPIIAAAAAGALAIGCSNASDTDTATNTGETTTTGAAATEGTTAPGTAGTPGAAPPAAPGAGAPGAAGADSTRIATPGGEFVVQGVILQKYNEAGASASPLGLPTAGEEPGPNGGKFSTFDGGAIYWTPQTGAHIVWGGIRDAWEGEGGAGGPLGYPTADEQTIPGGWQSEFQNGTITYTDGQARVEPR